MENRSSVITEEMKSFMQEGLINYAPACVALSEFRRQVRSRLQSVLDEFSREFSDIGLDVQNLKPAGPSVDNENLDQQSSWIGLKGNQAGGLMSGYNVEWNLQEPTGKQLWISLWIYLGRKVDRIHLFSALEKQRLPESKAALENSEGSAVLYSYLDLDLFNSFETTFRTLVQESLERLSGVVDIQKLTSPLTTNPTPPSNVE